MARCIECKKFIMKKMRCTHTNKPISKDQMYKNARCEFFDKKRNRRH